MPVIDDISDKTFKYDPLESDFTRGGLDWRMMHTWLEPMNYSDIHPKDTDAFPTPTMIGKYNCRIL